MDEQNPAILPPSFGNLVEITAIGPDQLSAVRHVHATAVRLLEGDMITPEDMVEWNDHVRNPEYTQKLLSACGLGAWLNNELIGTAGWSALADKPGTAKITSLYVRPLFASSGIGTRLLETLEAEAAVGGYHTITLRTFQNSASFFQSRGYQISSYGIRVISPRLSLPVTFMRKSANAPSAKRTRGVTTASAD